MIRMLKNTKDSSAKGRTQTINQMKAQVDTAPAELGETLHNLTVDALAKRCSSFWAGPVGNPTAAAKYALRSLAHRYRQLSAEIRVLEAKLDRHTRGGGAASALAATFKIRPDTAATLLVTAGVTLNASTLRLPSPRSVGSIRYLLRPGKPTGIGSTAAATAGPIPLFIGSWWSGFVMIPGPRNTCDAGTGKE